MMFYLQVDDRRGLFNDRFVVQDRQEEVIAITKTGEAAAFLVNAANALHRINELVRIAEISGETLTVDQLRDAIEGPRRALGPLLQS